MRGVVTGLAVLMAFSVSAGVGMAEDAEMASLTGRWHGDAVFLLPDGKVMQEHVFVFGEISDGVVAGEHMWTIPDRELHSHDGKEFTHESSEPFHAVVSSDGEIWLVEKGDTTMFRMNFIDDDTLGFIAMEGAPHSLVGRGTLVRE